MAYIANGGTPDAEDIIVPNIPFFPALSINLFREVMGVGQTVEQPKLEKYLLTAVTRVNGELMLYNAEKVIAGYNTLDAVPQDSYGAMKELVHHYQMAVFNHAKAELIENYRDYDTTRSGHDRADEMETRVDDYLKSSKEAIRKILGVPRATIELI